MAHKQLTEEYYKLLHEIQAVDFVLVELNLYLDTHPSDSAIIEQYNAYAVKSKQLKEEYARRYGPLQHGDMADKPYSWPDAPWPWQV
ncbi:spore coat protein CotJB [Tumebacillus sp. DT12]|uniref:Spore coat protein CotJB n=1 Tax=Tumebacillus lacus TaxID=2995335 RepID=A0ABT3WYQ5_9BACL|nr:spore coat protein CotJB [Tumebacillus lacus]MCX7569790.1 spore coat protein CotJB [Tumebacillus lacus]